MKINVKSISGKVTTLEVAETETIGELKQKLVDFAKTEVACMKIVCSGKVLTDNTKALVDCGIKENDTLALIVVKVRIPITAGRPSPLDRVPTHLRLLSHPQSQPPSLNQP